MLGHRGCRLGISYPEIYEMQARAIFEGAIAAKREAGQAPVPEIMIPLIATRRELEITRAQVDRVAKAVFAEQGETHRIPGRHHDRAAARRPRRRQDRRDRRLLQLRHQRPDADRVRPVPRRRRPVPAGLRAAGHPAEGPLRLDRSRRRRRHGADRRREGAPRSSRSLKMGICGEHGGDPASIAFCEEVGLDYVSCSPYRVPVARLAAAQAALGAGGDRTA